MKRNVITLDLSNYKKKRQQEEIIDAVSLLLRDKLSGKLIVKQHRVEIKQNGI